MTVIVKDIIKKVKKTISLYNMLDDGDRVLVAVSGGPDSVVLLDVLDRLTADYSLALVVAHFDHGLRPDDDDRETHFVSTLAAAKELPFVTEKGSSPPGKGGISLEEESRNRRYEFLNLALKTYGATKIALGHTLDDQAETVIMRLLRGSGPAGLSGIPPVRNHTFIRPLLEVTRLEIEEYILDRKLEHITDPSNLKKHHLRNRIRLDLMPQLETYQPRIVQILGQTADIMRDETRWLEREADRWITGHVKLLETKDPSMPLKAFGKLAAALQKQIIRQMIRRVQGGLRRIHLRHIEAVIILTNSRSQGRLNLPGNILVKKTYETLVFTQGGGTQQSQRHQGYQYLLEAPGVFALDAISGTLAVEKIKGGLPLPQSEPSPWMAYLNADRIQFPLTIRPFTPGDRFVPLGMKGHKKVKDFFIDLKVPTHVRKNLPLLCQGKDLIWVCGLRIDERFKVQPETRNIIRVSLSFSNGPLAHFFFSRLSKSP